MHRGDALGERVAAAGEITELFGESFCKLGPRGLATVGEPDFPVLRKILVGFFLHALIEGCRPGPKGALFLLWSGLEEG